MPLATTPPAASRVTPQPTQPIGGTIPATVEAQARRAHKLALDNHRTPEPTPDEAQRQLASQERSLVRELQTIEKELAVVRQRRAA
jgi:phosphoketolase